MQTRKRENAENTDTKMRKMQKILLIGFNVTGFRWPPSKVTWAMWSFTPSIFWGRFGHELCELTCTTSNSLGRHLCRMKLPWYFCCWVPKFLTKKKFRYFPEFVGPPFFARPKLSRNIPINFPTLNSFACQKAKNTSLCKNTLKKPERTKCLTLPKRWSGEGQACTWYCGSVVLNRLSLDLRSSARNWVSRQLGDALPVAITKDFPALSSTKTLYTSGGGRDININIFFSGHCLGEGGGGVSRPGGQGSSVYVLCAEPKEHQHFCSDARPVGSVTGVTKKLFMCQMFTCLFWPLIHKNTRWNFFSPGLNHHYNKHLARNLLCMCLWLRMENASIGIT